MHQDKKRWTGCISEKEDSTKVNPSRWRMGGDGCQSMGGILRCALVEGAMKLQEELFLFERGIQDGGDLSGMCNTGV